MGGRNIQHPTSDSPTSRDILIVTESIFSMDGDAAPLREIVALKEKYGAWLMVDEAHATGIIGKNGRGLADELGVGGQIEIQMGTLGKALGASGGYICGSRALIDFLINRARSFIFSTAPVPAAAAAATAGIQLAQSPKAKRAASSSGSLRRFEFQIGNCNEFDNFPAPSSRSFSAMKPKRVDAADAIARAKHFRPRHPLSHRRARRGAAADHADRRAFGRRCCDTCPRTGPIVNRKS